MAIQLITNLEIAAPIPADNRETKATVANALTIPKTRRYKGLTIFIESEGVEYWFCEGVEDSDFVVKSQGGGSSNYNELTNKPSINSITLEGDKTSSQLGLASSSELSTLSNELSALSDEVSDNSQDILEITNDISNINTSVTNINTSITDLNSDITGINSGISNIVTDITALDGRVTTLENTTPTVEQATNDVFGIVKGTAESSAIGGDITITSEKKMRVANFIPGLQISLYLDADNGNDMWDGLSPSSAKKTLASIFEMLQTYIHTNGASVSIVLMTDIIIDFQLKIINLGFPLVVKSYDSFPKQIVSTFVGDGTPEQQSFRFINNTAMSFELLKFVGHNDSFNNDTLIYCSDTYASFDGCSFQGNGQIASTKNSLIEVDNSDGFYFSGTTIFENSNCGVKSTNSRPNFKGPIVCSNVYAGVIAGAGTYGFMLQNPTGSSTNWMKQDGGTMAIVSYTASNGVEGVVKGQNSLSDTLGRAYSGVINQGYFGVRSLIPNSRLLAQSANTYQLLYNLPINTTFNHLVEFDYNVNNRTSGTLYLSFKWVASESRYDLFVNDNRATDDGSNVKFYVQRYLNDTSLRIWISSTLSGNILYTLIPKMAYDLGGLFSVLNEVSLSGEVTEVQPNFIINNDDKMILDRINLSSHNFNSALKKFNNNLKVFLHGLETAKLHHFVKYDIGLQRGIRKNFKGLSFSNLANISTFLKNTYGQSDPYPIEITIYFKKAFSDKIKLSAYNSLYSQLVGPGQLGNSGTCFQKWANNVTNELMIDDSAQTMREFLTLLYGHFWGKSLTTEADWTGAILSLIKPCKRANLYNLRSRKDIAPGKEYSSFFQWRGDQCVWNSTTNEFVNVADVFDLSIESQDRLLYANTFRVFWRKDKGRNIFQIVLGGMPSGEYFTHSVVEVNLLTITKKSNTYYMFKITPVSFDTFVLSNIPFDRFSKTTETNKWEHEYLPLQLHKRRNSQSYPMSARQPLNPNMWIGEKPVNSTYNFRMNFMEDYNWGFNNQVNKNKRMDYELQFFVLNVSTGEVSSLTDKLEVKHSVRGLPFRVQWKY